MSKSEKETASMRRYEALRPPTGQTNVVFERAVEQEMQKQLAAIRQSRESALHRISFSHQQPPPAPVPASGAQRQQQSKSIPRYNGYELSQTPLAIGFGRGLQQLHSDNLSRRRQEELRKKLMYQKELDRQLMEKRMLQRNRDPKVRVQQGNTPLNSLPLHESFQERERQRRKQLEYKQTLEQQMKEREEQRRKEQEMATVTRVEPCEVVAVSSPVPPKDSLQKHANQQKVQTILREQIFERKQREAEERRKREEQEAADEARIQREREELRLAYEREKELQKVQREQAQTQVIQRQELSSSLSSSRNQTRPRASTVSSLRRSRNPRRNSVSVSISHRRNSVNPDKSDTESTSLLADLDAKRREMVAMREQQLLLEKQIEQQRSELERLNMLRVTPERRRSVQVYSENNMLVDPWSGRRRNSFGSVESSSSTSAMPPRPPLRSTEPADASGWSSHTYEPLRRHSDLEQSMLSQSKLIASSTVQRNTYGDGSVWNKPKISESPILSQHKVLLQPVPETYDTQTRKVLETCEEESIRERSLPLASRYFVYVEQKKPAKPQPQRASPVTTQDSPLKTPVVRDTKSTELGNVIDEFEQSRVRTAHAARMALQRASAHSDDEDSINRGSLPNTVEPKAKEEQSGSFYDSIVTELELESSAPEANGENVASRDNAQQSDVTAKLSVNNTAQKEKQPQRYNEAKSVRAETPKGERYQDTKEQRGRFLVHTPSRQNLLEMESLTQADNNEADKLFFGNSEDELTDAY